MAEWGAIAVPSEAVFFPKRPPVPVALELNEAEILHIHVNRIEFEVKNL
jgi:hypothetical protein